MILITGHEGFIGGAVKADFDSLGIPTMGWEKGRYGKKRDCTFDWEYSLSRINREDRIKAIIHIGADSSTTNRDYEEVYFLNVITTDRLSWFCYNESIPFIYSSSAATYGDANGNLNFYGFTKKLAERKVVQRGQLALRYFNVYGPGESHKGDMASVAYKAYQKKLKGEKQILFPGSPRRDFVFIDDVVYANFHAFRNYKNLRGKAYEVGSGQARSFEDMMNILGVDYEVSETNPLLSNGYQNFTESKKDMWMPGWTPQYSLEWGLEKYRRFLQL